MEMKYLLITIIIASFLFMNISSGEVELIITDNQGVYRGGYNLNGSVTIKYNKILPAESVLSVYIDDGYVGSVNLGDKIQNPEYYNYSKQYFAYNLTSYGQNTWLEYEDLEFSYAITATGTCGGTYCGSYCSTGCPEECTSYPCTWATDKSSEGFGNVDAADGLKLIKDTTTEILEPFYNNNDTVWSEIGNNIPDKVETTMRAACGGGMYEGYYVQEDGWIARSIDHDDIQHKAPNKHYIEMERFDNDSLNNITKYGRIKDGKIEPGGPGGIFKFKDGEVTYQEYGIDVIWNGSNVNNVGYIEFLTYDSDAQYNMFYLPPNGPYLCAYTNHSTINSMNWQQTTTISGTDNKGQSVSAALYEPYTITYTDNELAVLLPPPNCPDHVDQAACNKEIYGYDAVMVSDPNGSVDFDYNAATKTINATTNVTDFDKYYGIAIDFSEIGRLTAYVPGRHALTFKIYEKENNKILGEETINFSICRDYDGDGFCPEFGDCSDNNPHAYPGAKEVCNGLDDDCDGMCIGGSRNGLVCYNDSECPDGYCVTEDEDFYGVEGRVGDSCGIPNSACSGYYVCTGDGSGVICNSDVVPGYLKEICDNNLDDDCDGFEDEKSNEDGTPACVCENNQRKKCGSNIGECREGEMICIDGEWSKCIGQTTGKPETCNGKDDNCDGVIDNVGVNFGERSSLEDTKCGCYGGALPTDEICNYIDDNCNGIIDENTICCEPGETRVCGTNIGICRKGTETCGDDSKWSGICRNSIEPTEEVCFNHADDDCDGEIDEDCEIPPACLNGIQDVGEEGVDCGGPCPERCENIFIWIVMAVVVIGVLLLVWIFVLRSTGGTVYK